MLESELQKITQILENNSTLQKLLLEFDVDFDSVARTLIEDVLFYYDELIQEETVYSLAENPNAIQGLPEITQIECTDDIAGSLGGKYFKIYSPTVGYYVWFNNGASTDPNPGGLAAIEVGYIVGDTKQAIASALQSALDSDPNFSATVGTSPGVDDFIVTVTNLMDGEVSPAVDSPSIFTKTGFDFTIYQQGLNPTLSIVDLNEAVSTALGLYPGTIASPHETYYRSYRSSEGTAYTYLLKWIYYCYKFFNKEQYFFHNLLNRYVPDYDAGIISSKNNLKIYFDGLGILLDSFDQKIEDLYKIGDIDAVDDRFLQHIAQLLGYQKEDFSIQNISFRELIKNLIEIYKTKGTVYSFTLFFKLLGFDADLREYYWDRDAKNPENFPSIDETDYLYYLTTQDPRSRTREQLQNMIDSRSIQPINTSEWVQPKDLRDFTSLQSQYSIKEILGFRNSSLLAEDRFTYFKTNFINFRLVQFYTKQDLTAKDTETILKYVKFLTPIYVSSLVEVVTTPWFDTFNMENPEAEELSEIYQNSYPGVPPWVDILLPFLFVTLRDYIPISVSPAPESAIVIANQGVTDTLGDGYSDTALPLIFGNPDDGISIIGTIPLTSPVDLSTYKYINLKVDKGRGVKISLTGSTIQTYTQLVNQLNTSFTANSLNAVAVIVGSVGNQDIRIYSNELGTDSNVYMVTGLLDDLFTGLSTTPTVPIQGFSNNRGYQDFGKSFNNGATATGLSTTKTYNFYINLDDDNYSEIDVSGINPSTTTLEQVVNAINNHYDLTINKNIVSSTDAEYIQSDLLTTGKLAVVFRDVTTNSGKMVLVNSDGTLFKSGINFSLYDVRDIGIAASRVSSVSRFLVAFYDVLNSQGKWTVYNTEGSKIITDQIFELISAQVQEIKTLTLSNNNIAIVYTTNAPIRGKVKIVDLSSLAVITTEEWYDSGIQNIAVATNGSGFVVSGNVATGGLLIYLKDDGTFAINNNKNDSTKQMTNFQIKNINIEETSEEELYITYVSNDAPTLNQGFFSIWDNEANEVQGATNFSTAQISQLDTSTTSNNNIIKVYERLSDNKIYYQVYSEAGGLQYKEHMLYDSFIVSGFNALTLSNGDLIFNAIIPNKIIHQRYSYLGMIASATVDNKLQLDSVFSADVWDDNIVNYARTTDQGHYFVMDNQIYTYDNYSTYYSGLGVDFTQERNRFNTFYTISPNDDLIDLIQDTINFTFTLLIAPADYPPDQVDKIGFHIQRNGYISRNYDLGVAATREKGYYTRHQDFSEPVRVSPEKTRKEINWPQWNRDNTAYDDWSSWSIAVDYFKPSITLAPYIASGSTVFSGTALVSTSFFTAPIPTGGFSLSGASGYQQVGL